MLTTEILKQNEALSGLSDEALQAIATMSENDEAQVVGSLKQSYEASALEISGVQKNKDEESVDYVKRILGDYKTKSTANPELQKKYDAAQGTIKELEEKIKAGSGDEALKKQLSDVNAQLEATRKQIEDDKLKYQSERAEFEKKYFDSQVKNAFAVATSGLKFKDGYTEGIKKALIAQAYAEVNAFGSIEIQEDGTIVFRDKDGKIMLNPKTSNKPYTMAEVVKQTSLKDALDEGKKQSGGGTGGNGEDGKGTLEDIDLSGCKTQVEADEAIKKYLLGKGYVVTKPDYQTKFTEIRKANEVSKLPIR